MLVAQLCLTLCDSMNCSPPGSSVHGILQARILEWVAMPSSRESSQPRVRIHIFATPALKADSLLLSHQGSLTYMLMECYTCVLWAKFKKYVNNKNDA